MKKSINNFSVLAITTATITAISLVSLNPIIYSQTIPKNWSNTSTYKPPQNIGRPINTTPGGVRGGEIVDVIPVVPEIEKQYFGVTVQPYPTFLVYIPKLNSNLKYAQFSLKDQEDKEIYKSYFILNTSHQIISISLPNEAGLIPLEIGQDYQWNLSLFTDPVDTTTLKMIGSGLIRRVEPSLQLKYQQPLARTFDKQARINQARLYAESGIWYDSVAMLAQLYREYPRDLEIEQDWETLLQSAKLNHLIGKQFVFSSK
jgi:hypothetical protein